MAHSCLPLFPTLPPNLGLITEQEKNRLTGLFLMYVQTDTWKKQRKHDNRLMGYAIIIRNNLSGQHNCKSINTERKEPETLPSTHWTLERTLKKKNWWILWKCIAWLVKSGKGKESGVSLSNCFLQPGHFLKGKCVGVGDEDEEYLRDGCFYSLNSTLQPFLQILKLEKGNDIRIKTSSPLRLLAEKVHLDCKDLVIMYN